ncbi:YkvA family protein [Bacteroides sp.]|uniref:YkvA family protein n=1 Tax=Bacteroides sp. TaxID=29523 RepID=UPI0025C3D071|nr:DUF1232 domain-containing protein [Bacteroides sp.]
MSFVVRFLQSNWIIIATKYTYNPKRLKALVLQLGLFLSRKGLTHLRKQLKLMYCYLWDITTGKYKDYDICSLIYIIAATLYLLSPVDMIPDFFPMGFVDDTAIIIWTLNISSKELERYKKQNSDGEEDKDA